MRILLGSDLYFPAVNGISQFTRNLAQGLAARGHTVGIIAASPNGKRNIEFEGDVTVYRTRAVVFPFYQNVRMSVAPQVEVRRIVKDFKPDVMHTQLLLGIGQAMMGVSERYRIPMVSTSHAMPENLMDNLKHLSAFSRPINYMLREYGRRFHNRADVITSPTQSAIDGFGKHAEKIKNPCASLVMALTCLPLNPALCLLVCIKIPPTHRQTAACVHWPPRRRKACRCGDSYGR